MSTAVLQHAIAEPSEVSLCRKCVRALAGMVMGGRFAIGDQLWACIECGHVRAWGMFEPWDPTTRAALGCPCCQKVERHRFVMVA